MNAALYIRVSTEDQLEFSPDAQKKALIEWAKKNGYSIDERYIFTDEGISGTSAKRRPAFMRMIATAKSKPKPFDAILVHKFDRFARSREDSVVYKSLLRKDCGIKVISITEQIEDDKFSVILEAMLEAMAEYYSLNLSDEVMKGMVEKANKCQVQAVAPFGYKIVNKKYEIVADQAEIVKLVFDKYVNEDYRCMSISKLLNSMGVKNIRNNAFESRTINRMLRNPVYIGTLRWNYKGRDKNYKTWVKSESEWIIQENAHDPIIDVDTFNKAQELLDIRGANGKRKRAQGNTIKHYLTGVLRCSACGHTLIYSANSSPYFQCCAYRKGKCNTSNGISVLRIEQIIKDGLISNIQKLNSNSLEEVYVVKKKSNVDVGATLNDRLVEVRKKYDIAKKAFLAEIDTLEEYAQNKKEIKAEEDEILKLMEDTSDEISIKEAHDLASKIQSFVDMLDDDSISTQKKNDTLKSFVSQIIFDKAKDTVTIECFI